MATIMTGKINKYISEHNKASETFFCSLCVRTIKQPTEWRQHLPSAQSDAENSSTISAPKRAQYNFITGNG